jgi:hypothetical protein
MPITSLPVREVVSIEGSSTTPKAERVKRAFHIVCFLRLRDDCAVLSRMPMARNRRVTMVP